MPRIRYAEKPCPLLVEPILRDFADFIEIKKMHDIHTSCFHKVLRRNLCYVSENIGFSFHSSQSNLCYQTYSRVIAQASSAANNRKKLNFDVGIKSVARAAFLGKLC